VIQTPFVEFIRAAAKPVIAPENFSGTINLDRQIQEALVRLKAEQKQWPRWWRTRS
jgi:hypothetical protein